MNIEGPKIIKQKNEKYVKISDLKDVMDNIEQNLRLITKYELYRCGLSEFKGKVLQEL